MRDRYKFFCEYLEKNECSLNWVEANCLELNDQSYCMTHLNLVQILWSSPGTITEVERFAMPICITMEMKALYHDGYINGFIQKWLNSRVMSLLHWAINIYDNRPRCVNCSLWAKLYRLIALVVLSLDISMGQCKKDATPLLTSFLH